MNMNMSKLSATTVWFAAVTLAGLFPSSATAQNQPQEVQGLIAAHNALLMKVRPLQKRVVAAAPATGSNEGFQPDGVPIRAKGSTSSGDSNSGADRRIPATLRHRDRTVSDSDEYGRIKVRLAALEDNIRAERQRVSQPGFGTRAGGKEIAAARKTLVALQKELGALEREVNASGGR